MVLATMALSIWQGVAARRHIEAADVVQASPEARILARYMIGLPRILPAFGRLLPENELRGQLDLQTGSLRDRIRFVAVEAELSGAEQALRRIEQLRAERGLDEEALDLEILHRLYAGEPVKPSERRRLVERHGWFARLAFVHGLPDTDPARRAVLAPCVRTAVTLFVAMVVAAGGVFLGLPLLILAMVFWGRGSLRFRFTPSEPEDGVWLETVALFLTAVLLITAAGAMIPGAALWTPVFMPGAAIVLFWPLLRGRGWRHWCGATGWHRGRGILRELGAGVAGYVACFPIFGLGFLITLLLSRLFGAGTRHPIVDEIASGGPFRVAFVYLAAAVWAPVVEETVFRGLLYRFLRSRASAIVSALMVGFLFAVVHPQGPVTVPVLASLGFGFCLIREWRGSILACVAAHALHNAATVTLILLLLG